jgi:hypothetical protein
MSDTPTGHRLASDNTSHQEMFLPEDCCPQVAGTLESDAWATALLLESWAQVAGDFVDGICPTS